MGHSEKGSEKPSENLGPNVISITPPPRFGMFGSMLVRIFLGFCILGAGVAAVYYSIEVHGDDDSGPSLSKTYFALNRTQFSLQGGVYTRELNAGDLPDGDHAHKTVKYESIWVQDHEHKRLYYTIGKPGEEDFEAYYVYLDYYLYVQNNKCNRGEIGYDKYIESFGLQDMLYLRREQILILSPQEAPAKSEGGSEEEEGKQFTDVNYYQGELFADEEPSTTRSRVGGLNADPPFLGFGYMDVSNTKTLAWQVYYPDIPANKVYFEEFWYPGMQTGPTDIDYFNNVTSLCQNV